MKLSLFVPALLTAVLSFPGMPAWACTNVLVTKGASKTGSTMVSYSADSHVLYGELYHKPAATYPAGSMLPVYEWDTGKYLGKIPQAENTYSTMGNMNEHQLIIAETTFGGRHELVDTTGLVDYGSLIYITLQRAKTAREAIAVMADLTARYGYCSEGESFSIADPNEVWIMEMVGKGTKMERGENVNRGTVWVAVRIPDGCISAHANQSRIGKFPLNDPVNCMYSHDVVSFAREKGYFSGKDRDFSFCDAYAPLDFMAMRGCEARVWSVFRKVSDGMDGYLDYALGKNPDNRMPLYVRVNRKLDVKDVIGFMRDHYEGTPLDMRNDIGAGGSKLPYRWRAMSFEVNGAEYMNERAIATQQTGFWFVGESRGWLPDMIGGILWFAVDDAGTSCPTPIYSAANRVPMCFAEGNGNMLEYSPTAAFWLFNRVANFAYLRYDMISRDILRVADRFVNECLTRIPELDKEALNLYKQNPEEARNLLTLYSVQTAQRLFDTWDQLDKYLFMKYMDGNMKRERNGRFLDNGYSPTRAAMPEFPGYDKHWQESVMKDAGDHLRVVKPNKK